MRILTYIGKSLLTCLLLPLLCGKPAATANTVPPATAMQDSVTINLDQYQWKNRLLLLFAPSEKSRELSAQLKQLQQEAAKVQDRDLKVFSFVEKGTSHAGQLPVTVGSAQTIRKRYNVEGNETLLLLIGKDGGLKMKDKMPVATSKVYQLIDSMPMRRREMKKDPD